MESRLISRQIQRSQMHPRDLKMCSRCLKLYSRHLKCIQGDSRANFSKFFQSLSNVLDGTWQVFQEHSSDLKYDQEFYKFCWCGPIPKKKGRKEHCIEGWSLKFGSLASTSRLEASQITFRNSREALPPFWCQREMGGGWVFDIQCSTLSILGKEEGE